MTADDDRMPDTLGPYRLLERIGEGGMGVVFMAQDLTGQTVALKVLRSVAAGDPTARHRLAREVETMRRVRSPYVAEVIGADLAGDTPYIVTRYVPGRTLDQVVTEGGPLLPVALLRLACGLADALAAVHAAGVVHRDLKPSNVMLLGEVPVVIDFGIAQGPDATRLTMTGMFMGTPGYLAPEVIEGQPSSEASDVHAWGATVAFAATGRAPFGTGGYENIFYRIVNGQPDLAGVPQALLPLLTAALARKAGLRPPAAQLSARAAMLDPAAMPRGAVVNGDPAAGPFTAIPATSADLAPGGPGAASPADAVAAVADGTGGVTASPADPATPAIDGPGPAGWGLGAAGSGLAAAGPGLGTAGPGRGTAAAWDGKPGTQPLMPISHTPADFADVLPPVQYQRGAARPPRPRPQPRPEPVPPPRKNPFEPRDPRSAGAASRSRWPWAMAIATMVIAVGLSVVLPVAAAPAALALIILLRAGDLSRERAVLRRSVRGAGPHDQVLMAASFPWYVIRSLLSCLLLAPFAAAAALIAGGVAIVVVSGHQLPRAVAVAAGTVIAFYGLAPGSARPRRQLSRIFGTVASSRIAQAVALAGMTALALATLAAAASWPSLYWPAGAPGGVWHFGLAHLGPIWRAGPIHHVGLLGRLLLLRLGRG